MAGTKTNTQNDTKTCTTSWRNRYLEKTIFLCVSDFSSFIFFFIYNFLNEFSKKCWVTALVLFLFKTSSALMYHSLIFSDLLPFMYFLSLIVKHKQHINYALFCIWKKNSNCHLKILSLNQCILNRQCTIIKGQ